MRLRTQKRICSANGNLERDRLSEMPDEVIVHILSCLPTLDAVRTVLLRCFGNLWTLVHSLKFDISDYGDVERFHCFVRNVLMLHKSISIDKFHLRLLGCDNKNIKVVDDVNIWLRFALDRQAKEIILCDTSPPIYDRYCSLFPNSTSQSLVTLKLSHCRIDPQLRVNLPSLKKLLLHFMDIRGEALQRFLSGCPSLQELDIVDPMWLTELSVSAPNIHKISFLLKECYDIWWLAFSNIKSLDLKIIGKIPGIISVSSVRDIYFEELDFFFVLDDDEDDEEERTMLKLFLGKIKGAEVFKLSCNASERFLHLLRLLDDSHLPQMKWKRVVLRLQRICESCLFGISRLLKILKHLEELIICSTLAGAQEVEFLKRVSSFQRASTKARVLFT